MINQQMNGYITRHEKLLRDMIEQADIPAPTIKQSILYTLFPGGKRLRPLLVYLTGELVGAPITALDYIAVAIELTHCYSLIHDDLPAMDNDDMRRGKPSCHRAYDEATAILAGDGMQALAIEILLTQLPAILTAPQVITVANELVKASGPSGMVSGQAMDLSELSRPDLTEAELRKIHLLKTGQLIKVSISAALAAGKPTLDESKALKQFAEHFGLVFQMQDDYLDRYSSNKIGKGRSSDLANDKKTYASMYTQETLRSMIDKQYQQASEALSCFGERANLLSELLNSLQQQI